MYNFILQVAQMKVQPSRQPKIPAQDKVSIINICAPLLIPAMILNNSLMQYSIKLQMIHIVFDYLLI